MDTTEKTRALNVMDCVDCYAVPGHDSMIDAINPVTGLGLWGGKTLEDCQEDNPGAVRMTIEDFCKQKAERQHTPIKFTETTAERFDEMLNVLPPAWGTQGYTAFLVGEPYDHDAETGRPRFQGFIQQGKKYYQSNRPVTVKEMQYEVTKAIILK